MVFLLKVVHEFGPIMAIRTFTDDKQELFIEFVAFCSGAARIPGTVSHAMKRTQDAPEYFRNDR